MSSFKTKICDKHGEYEAKVTVIEKPFRMEHSSICPDCEKEMVDNAIKRTESQKRSSIDSAIKRSDIPLRYSGNNISEVKPMNDDQHKIINRCLAYIDKYDELKKLGTSLIFTGKPGTGKTKIALSMIGPIIKNTISKKYDEVIEKIKKDGEDRESYYDFDLCKYINTYDLFMEIKSTYNKNSYESESDVIEKYINTELLIVDEVGAQSGSDYEVNTMFRIINSRYERMNPTFLISNLSEEDLSEYIGERTIDRFYENHGAVFVFDWESYRRS